MKKLFISLIVVFSVINCCCFASEISKISLSELQEKADLIVLAKVIKVEKNKNQDIVTIKIDSFLKGKTDDKVLVFNKGRHSRPLFIGRGFRYSSGGQ